MPSIPLHPRPSTINPPQSPNTSYPPTNSLPQLLQTPSGLALLELQGTINLPSSGHDNEENEDPQSPSGATYETPVGKIMFPDYSVLNPEDTKWMKRAYLYVGRYQRMTGEVKKLPKPLAIVQRRASSNASPHSEAEELEVVEIVRYKIFFKNRPEPVNNI